MRFCASVNGIASAGLKPMDIACNFGDCYNPVGWIKGAWKNKGGCLLNEKICSFRNNKVHFYSAIDPVLMGTYIFPYVY